MEDTLEERVQELAHHLLSNAVGDCGNAQRACFPCVPFGDVDASQRKGLISPAFQATFERGQVLEELTLIQIDGHAIDASGPSVASNAPEGILEGIQVDTTCQGMRFDPGQSRSFPAGAHGTKDRQIHRRETSWRMFLSIPLESGEAGRSRSGTDWRER
jgi:hypothetical protein